MTSKLNNIFKILKNIYPNIRYRLEYDILEKIEGDLMKIFPKDEWINFSHRITQFGRDFCIVRKPKCEECEFKSLC